VRKKRKKEKKGEKKRGKKGERAGEKKITFIKAHRGAPTWVLFPSGKLLQHLIVHKTS